MGRQFKDQILWLGRVWENWNEAERVVAIYSVARSLSPTATRFMLSVLSQNVPNDSNDITAAEARANDPAWVAHIPDSYDGGTQELLQHLPLLRPSNSDAKANYLTVIPKVLSQILSQPTAQPTMLEKARQLLSYSLIHPALSATERKSLASWIKSLEERLLLNHNEAFNGSYDPTTEEADEGGGNRRRSDSIEHSCPLDEHAMPVCTSSPSTEEKCFRKWDGSGAPELQHFKEDVRWTFLDSQQSPNHCGASPRSSGSESVPEEPLYSSLHPGMKGVGTWLKSLRLHKYANILCSLTYEELMSLTEENLESRGVTKGARHKIVLSVAKLRTRNEQLELIEKDIMEGRSLLAALNQLKSIIITPMMPSQEPISFEQDAQMLAAKSNLGAISDDCSQSFSDVGSSLNSTECDIPSRFTRVMGKVCTQLLVSGRHEDECVNTFLSLVDKGLGHESFNDTQKKKFVFWKRQVFKICHPMPPKGKEPWHNRRWSHQYSGELLTSRPWRFTQQRHSAASAVPVSSLLGSAIGGKKPHPQPLHFFPQASLSTLMTPRTSLPTTSFGGLANSALLSPQHFFSKRPSLQEPVTEHHRPHVTLQRTRSAPSRPNQVLSINHAIRNQQAKPDYSRSPTGCVDNPNFLVPSESLLENQMGLSQELDPDMTNRLESLCLSMTEHALG